MTMQRCRDRRRPSGPVRAAECQPVEARCMLLAPAAFASFPAFPAFPAVPAPAVPGVRATFAGTALTVLGTGRADDVALGADARGRVTLNGHPLLVRRKGVMAAHVRSIFVRSDAGDDRVDLLGVTPPAFPRLARAVVLAGDGDDSVLGSAGRDTLDGGAGRDTLRGLGGDDLLQGRAGLNFLLGNAGDDRLVGGGDIDLLYGGAGDDLLRGGAGEDLLCAAGSLEEDADLPDPVIDDEGADTLDGGADDDRYFLHGPGSGRLTFREAPDTGRDELNAAGWDFPLNLDLASTTPQAHGAAGHWIRFDDPEGFEALLGGRFDDVLYGNARGNQLDGQQGNNLLVGRAGDDAMAGFDGRDTMRGDDGDDHFWFYAGDDVADGGTGSDVYHWGGLYMFGRERIEEGPDADSDTLDFRAAFGPVAVDLGSTEEQGVLGITGLAMRLTLSDAAGVENVLTMDGNDYAMADAVRGNARPNLIATFAGDDAIDVAGGGVDTVFAGAGADVLTADARDSLFSDGDPAVQ